MSCYKFFLIILLSSSNFLINYVVASKVEEIIGGYSASRRDFKYQGAIIGKYNFSEIPYLLCSAAIISDLLLLSAARCFILKNNAVKSFAFYAVVQSDILRSNDINLKEIETIYTYRYTNLGYNTELAVTKLKNSLNLEGREDLASLNIPNKRDNFRGRIGIVSGYGMDSIINIDKPSNRERLRLGSTYGLALKYANVTVASDGGFRQFHYTNNEGSICGVNIFYFIEICGIIPPDELYSVRGVCLGDYGAPLVVDNEVIGVVTNHRKDCDDTVHGSIYTKVSNFKEFLDTLIREGRPISGANTYQNRQYISQTSMPHIQSSIS